MARRIAMLEADLERAEERATKSERYVKKAIDELL